MLAQFGELPRAFAGDSVNLASQGIWRFRSRSAGGALVDRVEVATLINTGTQLRYGLFPDVAVPDASIGTPTECYVNVERGPIASNVTQGAFTGANPMSPGASWPLINTGGSGGSLGNLHNALQLGRPIRVPFGHILIVATTTTVVGIVAVVFSWSELGDPRLETGA